MSNPNRNVNIPALMAKETKQLTIDSLLMARWLTALTNIVIKPEGVDINMETTVALTMLSAFSQGSPKDGVP